MNTCSFAGNLCWLMYNWSSEQASAPKPPLIPINYSWSPLPCVCSGAKPSQAPKAKGFSITRITRTVGAQVVPGFCSLCEEKTSHLLCSYVIVWMFDLHKGERPIRSLLSLASLDNSWASTHVAWSWQSNQEKQKKSLFVAVDMSVKHPGNNMCLVRITSSRWLCDRSHLVSNRLFSHFHNTSNTSSIEHIRHTGRLCLK